MQQSATQKIGRPKKEGRRVNVWLKPEIYSVIASMADKGYRNIGDQIAMMLDCYLQQGQQHESRQ